VFEIEGFAHSPTFGGVCTAPMALEFLADPSKAPDASCLEELTLEFFVQD
jgi:hypothetical protein